MSLVGTLVALGVMGLAMAALVSFLSATNRSTLQARVKSTQTALLNQASAFASNSEEYLEVLARSPYGANFVINCLNATAPNCSNVQADLTNLPEVAQAVGAGAFVMELPILSSNGQILAGTTAAGQQSLFTDTGAACVNVDACILETRGFAVMNGANDPGSLRFVMLARANPVFANNSVSKMPLAGRIATIDIGSTWEQPTTAAIIRTYAQETITAGVAPGRLLASATINSNTAQQNVSNTKLTIVQNKQAAMTCPDGYYMKGIKLDGTPLCEALSPIRSSWEIMDLDSSEIFDLSCIYRVTLSNGATYQLSPVSENLVSAPLAYFSSQGIFTVANDNKKVLKEVHLNTDANCNGCVSLNQTVLSLKAFCNLPAEN